MMNLHITQLYKAQITFAFLLMSEEIVKWNSPKMTEKEFQQENVYQLMKLPVVSMTEM